MSGAAHAAGSNAIVADELRRSFPSGVALQGLTLDLPAGEVLALLGPNGAGKTTSVRLFNGVLRPDSGTCRVLGLDPTADGDRLRRRTGVLTENAGLDDRLTAIENVVYTARLRGIEPAAAASRARKLLGQFGLTDRLDYPAQGMSTGQRKRVALARAMIHDPELLFLDEPTSGLDPTATRAVLDLVHDLAKQRGRTVVLCTHFLAEAGQLADRMAILHKGSLAAFGRPAELARHYFPGLPVAVDLGRPATIDEVLSLSNMRWIREADASESGARIVVHEREDVPGLMRYLVESGWTLYGATPQPPTLEDVYFAVEAHLARESGATDVSITAASMAPAPPPPAGPPAAADRESDRAAAAGQAA